MPEIATAIDVLCRELAIGSRAYSVLGLILDILGFSIIALSGWWALRLGSSAEALIGEYEKNRELAETSYRREQKLRLRHKGGDYPDAMIDGFTKPETDAQKDHTKKAKTALSAARTNTLFGHKVEARSLVVGSSLIVAGFILQLLGAMSCA